MSLRRFSSASLRRYAHCVIDATAKHQDLESILLFHAPWLCLWHSHDAKNRLELYMIAVNNDVEYFPKARGEKDFARFTEPA
jgi:hypothetical protein